MVDIAPFRALRYTVKKTKPDISAFICPPYDVISPDERQMLEKKSAVNIVQLELPAGEGAEKYSGAAAVLRSWKSRAVLQEDRTPSFYLLETTYRIADAFAPAQRLKRYGVLTGLRLETPGRGAVHPHEKTLPKAKEDRLHLLTAVQTNVSPIFGLFFDKKKQWRTWVSSVIRTKPLIVGKEHNDLSHRLWKIDDPRRQKALRAMLASKDLYIADGHHRYEVGWAYREVRMGAESQADMQIGWRRTMAYICPMEEPGLLMLPTHRLVKTARTPADWRKKLETAFEITPVKNAAALVAALKKTARAKRTIGFLAADGAALLTLRPDISLDRCLDQRPPALRELDVVLLHDMVFCESTPDNDLKDKELIYTRNIAEMEKKIAADPSWAGFLLGSPGVDSLARVAGANEVMPPKTTYFYPKVPTGFTMMPLEQTIG